MSAGRHLGALLTAIACVAALALASAGSVAAAAPGKEQGKPHKTKAERKRERLRKMRRANARQKRPNVIVVMTDDQNVEMDGLPETLRLLGTQGTTFTNSYVSFPLCCPSRATFLTGQYSHNHGVVSTALPNGYNGLNHLNTLPVWLRRSGYRTGMVGKYLNGYGIDDSIPEPKRDALEIPPGWADWYGLTGGLEQRRYKYKLNENGKIHFYKRGAKNYVTDVLAGKAVSFVKRQAPHRKPFFLWFNPTAPHGEAGVVPGATRDPQPAPRHLGAYEGATVPRTPNFNEADVSDKGNFVRGSPLLNDAEIQDLDRRYRGRLESMLSVDDSVKRIVRRVKKAGDMRRTYIFFTSDNGLLLGAHRQQFKDFLYEEALRVPLIIRGPNFPRGAIRDQPVSNVDLAPTIADITHVTPGLDMDGRTVVPFGASPSFGQGRELLFESRTGGLTAGIRSGNYVYIDNGPGDTPELYDLVADPYELDSQHANPALAGIRTQLAARLNQLKSCSGAACP